MTLIDYFNCIRNNSEKYFKIVYSESEHKVTYQQFYDDVTRTSAYLNTFGLDIGTNIVLFAQDEYMYLKLFWACQLSGFVPIIVGCNLQNLTQVNRIADVYETLHCFTDIQTFYDKLMEIPNVKAYQIPSDLPCVDRNYEIRKAEESDLAIIQFSSGSIYEPKGIALTQENIVCNVLDMIDMEHFTSEDTFTSWLPVTHNFGLVAFHIMPLMLQTNQIVISVHAFQRNPFLWLTVMEKEKTNVTSSNNAVLKQIAAFAKNSKIPDYDLSNLWAIFAGSEMIRKEDCEFFYEQTSKLKVGRQVIKAGYGLTEGSLVVSVTKPDIEVAFLNLKKDTLGIGSEVIKYPDNEPDTFPLMAVGHVLNHVEVVIVDDDGKELPSNHVGHVHIKGKSVIKSYYAPITNKPESFTEDGYLITGDIGFFHEEQLYLLGREKDMFIIRGKNYYYGDIESAILEKLDIKQEEIAITSIEENMEESVICFITEEREQAYGKEALMEDIRNTVNKAFGFAITYFVAVPQIPVTSLGKKKRTLLRDNFLKGTYSQNDILNAENSLEDKLIDRNKSYTKDEIKNVLKQILKEKLQIEGESVETENIFELCGNSLRFYTFYYEVKRIFESEISIVELIRCDDISEMATAIFEDYEKMHKETETQNALDQSASAQEKYYDVGEAQMRMMIGERLSTWEFEYHNPVVINVDEIPMEKIKESMATIVSRHESLRTEFRFVGTKQQQVVLPTVEIPFEEVVVDDMDAIDFRSYLKPFDLKKAPLFHLTYFKSDSDRAYLLIDVHHIISDGISFRIIVRELLALCRDETLSETPLQYGQYVAEDNEFHRSEEYKALGDYWKQRLEGVQYKSYLKKNSDYQTSEAKMGDMVKVIDETSTEHIKQFCAAHNISSFQYLVGCLQLMLHSISGENDIVVSTMLMNRMKKEYMQTVGVFSNQVPVYTIIDDDMSIADYFSMIQKNGQTDFMHQQYAYNDILRTIDKDKLSNGEFSDIYINYESMYMMDFYSLDVDANSYEYLAVPKYPLYINVFEDNNKFVIDVTYIKNCYEDEIMNQAIDRYLTVLKSIYQYEDTKTIAEYLKTC